MMKQSVNTNEKKSYKSPLEMTDEEYLEMILEVAKENEKLTDEELMRKYYI